MVVDSSVLLQILFAERGAAKSVATLGRSAELLMAAPTLFETEILFGARRGFNSGDVAELVERLAIDVHPLTREHVLQAKLAYGRFGKGQGHEAQLNFGDCVSNIVRNSGPYQLRELRPGAGRSPTLGMHGRGVSAHRLDRRGAGVIAGGSDRAHSRQAACERTPHRNIVRNSGPYQLRQLRPAEGRGPTPACIGEALLRTDLTVVKLG